MRSPTLAIGALVLGFSALTGCNIVISGSTADEPILGGEPTTIKIHGSRADGDFRMSGRLGLDASKLTITLAAIRDPEAPTRPVDPTKVSFAMTGAADASVTCTIVKVSSSTKAGVDLVFINDTTGSMAGTVNGIADSVQKFAEDISSGGIDARLSMYTYGDAFATKSATDTTFTLGQGDFAPPTFDQTARPYVGLGDLTTFKGFLGELRASRVLGVGGGDGEENTLGALRYANDKVAWRDGAARMFVAIGDNPSHQKGDGSSLNLGPNWEAPDGNELVSSLAGTAAVHVVGHDITRGKFFNLKRLADGTGGAFLDLPSNGKVDLGALNLKEWLTSSFTGSCGGATAGRYTITLRATITGSKTFVGTLSFDVEIG